MCLNRKSLVARCSLLVALLLAGSGTTPTTGRGQAPLQTYSITDFSGGMVTDFDNTDIPGNYGNYVVDWGIDEGRLGTRHGITKVYQGDSAFHALSAYKFPTNGPALDDTCIMRFNGEVLVIHSSDHDTIGLEKLHMRPFYAPSTDTANYRILGKGKWKDELSTNKNVTVPGREFPKQSSGLEWNAYNGVLRGMAGPYSLDTTVSNNRTFSSTSPWWFGYIGRYFWSNYTWVDTFAVGREMVDNYFLYSGSLVPPDSGILKARGVVYAVDTTVNWEPLGIGVYWLAFSLEYDGFQQSVPTFSSWFFVNDSVWPGYPSFRGVAIKCSLAVTNTSVSRRITAINIFSSDSLKYDDPHFSDGGSNGTGDGLPYFFRKRVVISDPDSTELGYRIRRKVSTGDSVYQWSNSSNAQYRWINVYLINDDFAATQPEMWSYLGHESKENIVLPRYAAIIKDQSWAADVKIDALTSKVHERYRNLVIYSPIGQPDSYPINNIITVGGGGGSYITGIKEMNGNALIWTNDALEVWAPGELPQRLEQFVHQGCTAPRSIQITPRGAFYANNQELLLYSGSGVPENITRAIKSVYDSASTYIGIANGGLSTMTYSTSAYVPSLQQYLFTFAKSGYENAVGALDTLGFSDGSPTLRDFPDQRNHGGLWALIYSLKNSSWSLFKFPTGIHQTFYTWDGRLQFVENNNGLHQFFYEYPGTSYGGTVPLCLWQSGWTYMGSPGVEKELKSVELDFELEYRDTLKVAIYADGRTDTIRTLKFYQTDSLSGGWRKSQARPITSGQTIVDPPNGHWPELYKYNLSWVKGDTFGHKTDTTAKVNAIRVNWTPKERRAP